MFTSADNRYWGCEVYKPQKNNTLLFLSFNFCEVFLHHAGRIVENVPWGDVHQVDVGGGIQMYPNVKKYV